MRLVLRLLPCLLLAPVAPAATAPGVTLAARGSSNYRIIHPVAAPLSVTEAVQDLRTYLSRATGAELSVAAESGDFAGPLISVGETAAARAAGLRAADVPLDGYRIVVRDGNVYILGPDGPTGKAAESRGSANGVYTFLEDYVGARWLTPGAEGEVVPKHATLTIPSVDRTEYPVVPSRVITGFREGEGAQWMRRQKQGSVMQLHHSHNWEETIPEHEWEKHPEWFAEIDGVHAKPARRYKLETTNPELQAEFARRAVAKLKESGLYCFSLSPTDGSYGWSTSRKTLALLERDPNGQLSRTPLVLSWYRNVAKLVQPEMPDRIVAGYVYASYMFPPSGETPLPSNLFLVAAPSFDYGYQLYRPKQRQDFDVVMQGWRKLTPNLGYYDLPTNVLNAGEITTAPGVEILEFIYPRLFDLNIQHIYIYGVRGPSAGLSNYLRAKLNWNPRANVRELADDYCRLAYGEQAGPIMRELHAQLDAAFARYYRAHPRASYTLTADMIKGIYAEAYPQLEATFLRAKTAVRDPEHRARLGTYERSLVALQAKLRELGVTIDARSPLFAAASSYTVPGRSGRSPAAAAQPATEPSLEKSRVRELAPPLPGAPATRPWIIEGDIRIVMYADSDEEVNIVCTELSGDATAAKPTFVHDSTGRLVGFGTFGNPGDMIKFAASERQSYILDFRPPPGVRYALDVRGSGFAVRPLDPAAGLRVVQPGGPLYLYGAAGDGAITLSFDGAAPVGGVTVTAPDGTRAQTRNDGKRVVIDLKGRPAGFWTVTLPQGSARVAVDSPAGPWLGIDPRNLLVTERGAQ